MNCTNVLELAPLYLTGELEPGRAEQVSAHLEACPSCAREIAQQRTFDSLLRRSVLAEPADSSRVERSVRQIIANESRRRWLGVAGIAAALLLAALGTWVALRQRAIPVYAAAARDHRIEIVDGQPRQWFTDRTSIGSLARAQGVPDSAIDAMAPAGYRLEKGKVCRLDGQLFLHLVYVNGAANFSIFLRRAGGGGRWHTESRGAEHVAGFEEHQLAALVVTEQGGDAAERVARSAASVL